MMGFAGITYRQVDRDDHRIYVELVEEDEDGHQQHIFIELVVNAEGLITNQLQNLEGDDEITKSAWATWEHVLEGLT